MHALKSHVRLLQRSLLALCCLVAAATVGAAQPASTAPVAAPLAPSTAPPTMLHEGEYVLGSGDIIHITVFQNPDLTVDTRVSEIGMITFPLIGNVKVGGLTVSAAEQLIATRLRDGRFVQQPQVNILPTQIVGSQIAVLGEVNKPGRYPLNTVDTHLSDMLATAGGIAPDGADSVWLIGVRDGKVVRKRLDTAALFIQGSQADEQVHGGDVLFVDREPMFYIYGEVQKPGAYRLERDMTIMQGLASGGGLTAKGTERGLRIHRRDKDQRMQEIEPALDDALQPNDVIYIRASMF